MDGNKILGYVYRYSIDRYYLYHLFADPFDVALLSGGPHANTLPVKEELFIQMRRNIQICFSHHKENIMEQKEI